MTIIISEKIIEWLMMCIIPCSIYLIFCLVEFLFKKLEKNIEERK